MLHKATIKTLKFTVFDDLSTLKRDDIACNMIYDSNVNPGGNVPARAVRAIFARVYPSFVKGFGEFVIKKTLNEPILF